MTLFYQIRNLMQAAISRVVALRLGHSIKINYRVAYKQAQHYTRDNRNNNQQQLFVTVKI